MSQTRSVREVLALEVLATGVPVLSGLLAEDNSLLVSEIVDTGVEYLPTKHENVAVSVAEGYAWASGGLALATVGRGPAIANAGVALGNLVHGRRPVLIITTIDLLAGDPRSGAFKAMDQWSFVKAFGLEHVVPHTADDVVSCFRTAVALARSGRPTVFAVPHLLLTEQTTVPEPPEPPAELPPPTEPAAADVDQLIELLQRSERPIILAGTGALHAKDALIAVAERSGALLATSLLAKDLFRGHPLDLGIMGGYSAPVTAEVAAEADTIFAFGASVNMWTRGHGLRFPQAQVVAVDNDPTRLGKLGPIEVGVVGDALLTAEAVLTKLPDGASEDAAFHEAAMLGRISDRRPWHRNDQSTDDTIDPRLLTDMLHELLPERRQVLTDGGHFMYFPAVGLYGEPLTVHQSGEFVAVGLGLGNAIGAALARPELTTVAAMGDGGLSMTLGDLEPLVHFPHPIVVVIYNDQAYGAERHLMDLLNHDNTVSLLEDVDFAAIAAAMGIESATVRSADDLRRVAPLLRDPQRPIVLDCKVNPLVRSIVIEEGHKVLEAMAREQAPA